MLHTEDFETWRNHLRSFIPEGNPNSDKKIYVTANDGRDLEAVDLSHIFDSNRTVGSLVQAVSDKVRQMQRDKVDQPGLIGSLMPKGKFVFFFFSLLFFLALYALCMIGNSSL